MISPENEGLLTVRAAESELVRLVNSLVVDDIACVVVVAMGSTDIHLCSVDARGIDMLHRFSCVHGNKPVEIMEKFIEGLADGIRQRHALVLAGALVYDAYSKYLVSPTVHYFRRLFSDDFKRDTNAAKIIGACHSNCPIFIGASKV